ncbi:MAG: hypothetical protein Q7K65_01615 [Candidatus Buchananbacteria bacterium]|nr:hypothetical protein [Candidatus Buchananbacteria bacterium]
MKNKIIYILGGMAVIAIVIVVFISIKQSSADIKPRVNTPSLKTKLQLCPDEWIDNQMPSTDLKKSETQYFIFNGKRRELNEFDVEWIQKNCSLKKQVVY